jgi:glycosidase
MIGRLALFAFCIGVSALGVMAQNNPTANSSVQTSIPEWSKRVVWYQIFPERFRDGDPKNQPIRESIEYFDKAPMSWHPTKWTMDWYKTDDWEKELKGFYDPSVFMRRYGGDLQGVIDKLDYLKTLGITGLYFNPVFYARSMHKYDASSFHHIEPYFGPDPQGDLALIATETADPASWKWTKADQLFLQLLQQAHRRGIHVIIDGVFNHSGRDFFAFADLVKKQEKSAYKDWYMVQKFDDPATPQNEFKYKGWWNVDSLPEFADVKTPNGDDAHPAVKQYFMDITKRWMDPNGDGNHSDGIDGWRLDVANEVPILFWKDWNAWVRRLNPEAYTVTELWENGLNFVKDGGFTATKNYHGLAFPVNDFLVHNRIKTSVFAEQVETRMRQYPTEYAEALMNLVDSHDTDRIASMVVNRDVVKDGYDQNNSPRWNANYLIRKPNAEDRRIQKLVALFQFTFVGAPMIYYGTEAGMWGGDDPDDRKPMLWADLRYEDEAADPRGRTKTPENVVFDRELFRFYQSLIALRKRFHVFSTGTFEWLQKDDATNTFVFARKENNQQMLVAINRSNTHQVVKIPMQARRVVASFQTVVSARASLRQNMLTVSLPPLSGVVIRVE